MIIHHVSPMEAEKLRRRLRLEDKDTLLHELKDRFGNFQFRKGKSCLFKASIDTLLVQLQTVPMYAMLMDLWPRKPALVGSTLIPLKKAIDKISADVYQKGIAVPSLYRDEGEFDIYNLMGSCIATVKLGFRLLSLGGTLIPHIPTEALATKTVQKVETGGKMEQELSCLTGRQQVTDTAQPSSLSSQPKSTATSRQQQVPRRPPTVTKSEVYKKQIQSAAPSKRAQSSVIGLSSRRVRFKQTSLTYGMTKTQKMRLELNQKDKTANRTRPCEAHAALAEKENVKRDSIRTVLRESGLGMTYRIGSTKRSTIRGMKQSVDAQNQTQPVVEQLTHENGVAQSSTLDIKEETGVKL